MPSLPAVYRCVGLNKDDLTSRGIDIIPDSTCFDRELRRWRNPMDIHQFALDDQAAANLCFLNLALQSGVQEDEVVVTDMLINIFLRQTRESWYIVSVLECAVTHGECEVGKDVCLDKIAICYCKIDWHDAVRHCCGVLMPSDNFTSQGIGIV